MCYKEKTLSCAETGKGKPKKQLEPNVLTDNGILEQNNNNTNDRNTSNDNAKEPNAPKVTGDLGGLNDDVG